MTTPEELDALVARLLDGPQRVYRDLHAAKKAATAITALRARVAELEAAIDQLQYIASANATRATPAPVVPAEGLDALQRRAYSWQVEHEQGPDTFRDVRNNPAHAHEMLESAHVLIDDLASALRSAPPVGARVRPWETRPADPDAMIPATVEVHRGAWAVVIGTNGKPAGWIDTHDLFANQLYRDHILTTPAALLPAGEGEE